MNTNAETTDLAGDLADLESAEDFLEYFNIAFDPAVVHVNRLHILQRFHDYLANVVRDSDGTYEQYRVLLARAYDDFVHSNAQTEKVFSVLKRASGIATIPLSAIGRARH